MAIAITVLFSVADHVLAARELARVLKPGGALLLFEPAFESLRRAHDVTVHGIRRYRRSDLAALATDAGLRVRRATYVCSFLAPPAALLHVVQRRARNGPTHDHGSDVERRSLDRVFAPLAAAERRWLTRRNIAVGTSVAVVATKD